MKYTLPAPFKYWFFVCLLVGGLLPVRGQYVTIPDTAFVSWLNNNGYSQCMNGNQLDTTCNAVLTTTNQLYIEYVPIHNLEGIEYFKNISNLYCSNDSLNTIPSLPAALNYLDCSYNQLNALPALPPALQTLNCMNNYPSLTTLPVLPSSLLFLFCDNDSLTALPTLPAGLLILYCYTNYLTILPTLPNSLGDLDFSNNEVPLPASWPSQLQLLHCNFTQTANILPSLPNTLQYLSCEGIRLHSLPSLPAGLKQLDCESNLLTALPNLPDSLTSLICDGNLLTALPALPATLTNLNCGSNSLTTLPALPPLLQTLFCSSNQLVNLPPLSATLIKLDCSSTAVTSLPALPAGLTNLYCTNTPITFLPELPDIMSVLECDDDANLTCLPRLKQISYLSFFGSGVQCLPNYGNVGSSIPALNSVPLCGIFNPTGCEVFWTISGKTYYDANSNCSFDSSDVPQANVKVLLDSAGVLTQQVLTGGEGFYSFLTGNGNFTSTVDTSNLPFTLLCPGSGSWITTISQVDSLSYNNDFAFKCRSTGFDVGVTSILNSSDVPRLGAYYTVNVIAGDISQLYGANCASGIGGQVQVTYSGSVAYQYPAPGALTPSVGGNTLTYTIADFGAVNDYTSFNAVYRVNPNAITGSDVCITVNVTPTAGDNNLSNNTGTYCFSIINALDPNEKEVYPATVDSANQWLTYTVRFQNTGTAPAVNIIVRDTLNPNLDPASFQLLAYSAKNLTQLFGNVVVFNFPNINLADSATSDSLSRGFVQYRVKTISNMQQNAVITNTASIYFDNNPAIATNTVTDTVATPGTCTPTDTGISVTICAGDSVLFNGVYYHTSGTYSETLTNAGGCDSVVNLALIVLAPVAPTELYDTICSSDSILFNGIYYNQSGNYSAHYSSARGCDSLVTFQLMVDSSLACGHLQYAAMLDSANMWQYVFNIFPSLPPPYNPNGNLLRGNCQYPLGFSRREYTGADTTINGISYKQVLRDFGDQASSCLIGFIREDVIAQKVYFQDILSDPEQILYNYSLQPGDYFSLRKMDYAAHIVNVGLFKLDSVQVVQIAGGKRKKFFFDCDTCQVNDQPFNNFSWIEGVGDLSELVYPLSVAGEMSYGGPFGPCNYVSGPPEYPYDMLQILSCFSHYETTYFDSCAFSRAENSATGGGDSIVDSCFYYVIGGAINQITSLNSFTIYPNPASAQITLQFDVGHSEALDITLLDATGRQVLPAMNTGLLAIGTQTRQMNIEGLASGFYLVACKNASGAIYRKLIVRGE